MTSHSWPYSENTRFGYVPIPVPWFNWPWQVGQTINLLTYSMEQSPSWEVGRFSASQEIPRILWNLKVHYSITSAHHCPCSQPDQSSHAPHPISWTSILILPSQLRLGLPSDLCPTGFPTKTPYTPLLSPIRATCPSHFLLDLITRTILGERYRSLSSSLSFLHSPVTSSSWVKIFSSATYSQAPSA